jgi:hypothetical protein
MSRYYAGSKPVRALRRWFGIEKPNALQWGEWDDWKKATKANHPVGYWLTEKLPNYLEKIPETFVDPFHNISYYIRNRWHRQTHVLRTGFKPGTYHDFRERILYGLMESMVDFVEVEKAWMQYIWHDDNRKLKLGKGGRSADLGLEYLRWEMSLDDPALSEGEASPAQAAAARELYAIYMWWKVLRPARPDPYSASGWDEHSDGTWNFLDERIPRDPEKEAKTKEILGKLQQIETDYDTEDNEMLHRLIKIRLSLWT